jgi:hypothetical protein
MNVKVDVGKEISMYHVNSQQCFIMGNSFFLIQNSKFKIQKSNRDNS